jgi:alpha 1,2-mannosyltransferase
MNSAIIYLSHNRTIEKLNKSLELLHLNFNKNFNYPIVIFHENNFNFKKVCKNKNILFYRVDFKIPSFIEKEKISVDLYGHSIGYRHMCRFFSYSIFDLIKNYEYYMRLDDDSYILSKIEYDIFNFMKDNEKEYAYRVKTIEHNMCVRELEKFFLKYLSEKNIKPKFLFENFKNNCWNKVGYYNNFHISKTEFWLRKDVQNFMKAVDLTGGYYFNRWGDAMIQTLAVQIFAEKQKVHQFLDFDYEHKSDLGNNVFFGGFFGKDGNGQHCKRTFQNSYKNFVL